MRIRNAKMNYLSHEITQKLLASDAIDYRSEPNEIRLRIKAIIEEEMLLDDLVDEVVRNMLNSYSKNKLQEGSREWDVEYERLYELEMEKRRRG